MGPPLDLETIGRARAALPPYPSEFDFIERRRKAVEFRTARIPYEQIGLLLYADPAINSRHIPVTGGYGWRQLRKGLPPLTPAALVKQVVSDIAKQKVVAREALREQSILALEEEIATVDAVTQAMWAEMSQGSHWHAFRVLQSVELRAKLRGWLTTTGNPITAAAADAVDAASEHRSVEGPQPDWEAPGFMADVLAALHESELIPTDSATAALAELPAAVTADSDVIDVEAVEADA